MYFLIGLDDTNKGEGKYNTGRLAMMLGERLAERLGCQVISVTRHQLHHHNVLLARSPHNMAACLRVDAPTEMRREIELYCREFLLRWSSPDSNAGFALAQWNYVTPEVQNWGKLAKRSYLVRQNAAEAARRSDITLVAMRGNGAGVIGALAAVALLYSGEDGRFIWMPGLRELRGILSYNDLMASCPLDRVENDYRRSPLGNDLINLGERPRPLLRNSLSCLPIESTPRGTYYFWQVPAPERIDALAS